MAANLIKRTKRNDNFTIVNNDILRNPNMSFEAKGMLCYILSLPDDWILHTSKLMSDFKIGRHYLKRCFDEIEKCGYMAKVGVVKGKGGRFEGYSYMFYDTPIAVPRVDSPYADFPHTEEQHLQRTNIDNKELTNTNNPLTPLKGGAKTDEEVGGINFEQEVDEFIDAYKRIYQTKLKRFMPNHLIDRRVAKKNLKKWILSGGTKEEVLKCMFGIIGNKWEFDHNYPSLSMKRLITPETVRKYSAPRAWSDDSDLFGA